MSATRTAAPRVSERTVRLPRVRFPRGSVVLAGAGPGGKDHVTLQALAYLRRADVVVYDRLAAPTARAFSPAGAELVPVGKRAGGRGWDQERIHALLVDRARRGGRVVRWKGGDPFVFGRGAEERDHLRARGVPVLVVPGVSSITGALSAGGIPPVHRDLSSSFAVLSGESGDGAAAPPSIEVLSAAAGTLVVVMSVGHLERTISRIERIRGPDEPAAVVERGTLPGQRVLRAPLGELAAVARRSDVRAPALLVVGRVAAPEVAGIPSRGTEPRPSLSAAQVARSAVPEVA